MQKTYKKITVSFKENELWLYEALSNYSSPASTIKDVLKSYFRDYNKNEKLAETNIKNEK